MNNNFPLLVILCCLTSFWLSATTPNFMTVDLELSNLTTSMPGIYASETVEFSLTNNSSNTATGIIVTFSKNQINITGQPVASLGMPQQHWTDNPFWEIPSLGAGQTATIELPVFTLGNDYTLFAEVTEQNEVDEDSTPDNGNGVMAVEDDEAVFPGTVVGTPMPDLTIGDWQIAGSAPPNTILNYTIDISNVGNSFTADFSLGIFISTDATLSNDDVLVGEIPTSGFGPNGFANNVFGQINLNGIAEGSYRLIAKVDSNEEEAELDETNNMLVRPFTVTNGGSGNMMADLELTMTANNTTPPIYTNTRITLNLRNNGPTEASSIIVEIPKTSDWVVAGDGNVTASMGTFSHATPTRAAWFISNFPSGQTATVSFDIFTLASDLNLYAQVIEVNQPDPDSSPNNGTPPQVNEDDEANLQGGNPSGNQPELTITNVDYLNPGVIGDTQAGTIYCSNNGDASADNLELAVYLSVNDDQLSPDDMLLDNPFILNFPAGTSDSRQFYFSLPSSTVPGDDYFLIFKIDDSEQYDEADEANNIYAVPYAIVEAGTDIDYSIASVDFPNTIYTDLIYYQSDVEFLRTGNNTECELASINMYLSNDAQLSADDILLNDRYTRSSANSCSNGFRTTIQRLWFGDIPPGNYYLITYLDAENELAETNEDNNGLAQPLSIQTGETPECPSNSLAGDDILCSEVQNNIIHLYTYSETTIYDNLLNENGELLSSSVYGSLVEDSTIISGNQLTYKTADGAVQFSATIPQNIFNYFNENVLVTRLSDGSYLFGGTVAVDSTGTNGVPYSGSKLRLVKTDANLNIINTAQVSENLSTGPFLPAGRLYHISDNANGQASIYFTTYNSGSVIPVVYLQAAIVDANLTMDIKTTYDWLIPEAVITTPCGHDLVIGDINFSGYNAFRNGVARVQLDLTAPSDQVEISYYSDVLSYGGRDGRVYQLSFFKSDQPRIPSISRWTTLFSPFSFTNIDPYRFDFQDGTVLNGRIILFGNFEGQPIALPTNCDNPQSGDGTDIALSLAVDNSSPSLWSNVTYTLTATNVGDEAASGLVVDFDNGSQNPNKPLAFSGSDNPDYDSWNGVWNIGDLAPGEAQMVNVDLFVLQQAIPSVTLTAFVSSLNEMDSNAANDEATATITVSGTASLQSSGFENATFQFKTSKPVIRNLYPNPAQSQVQLIIESPIETNDVPVMIVDGFGKALIFKNIDLSDSVNMIVFDIGELPEGVYTVYVNEGQRGQQVKRFVKME